MILPISNRRGFTLIEMLTVIAIIGILLAVALPVMTHLSRSSALQGAIRQVSNSASLARQFAITHRVNTELRIANTFNAVTVLTNGVQIDKWDFFPPGVYVDPSATPVLTNVFTPTGGTIASVNQQIVIREAAGTNSTGTALIGTNSNLRIITINNIVGRIAINRP